MYSIAVQEGKKVKKNMKFCELKMFSSQDVIIGVIMILASLVQSDNAVESAWKDKCLNKTTFVDICTTQLIVDPNSDQLSSQKEFVSFLNGLAANYSQTNATGPSSFDASLIAFQLPYMSHLCSYMVKQENTTSNYDCQEMLFNNSLSYMTRDNFGFPFSSDHNGGLRDEISILCSELYIPSIEAGYISPCLTSIPPVNEVSIK